MAQLIEHLSSADVDSATRLLISSRWFKMCREAERDGAVGTTAQATWRLRNLSQLDRGLLRK